MMAASPWYVGGIDQGTTSTRVILYNSELHPVVSHQLKHKQITPQPGWLQHNPLEILQNATTCINEAVQKLLAQTGKTTAADLNLKGFGITNQRETIVVWDKTTGLPLYDAIVWCDLRCQDVVDDFVTKHGKSTLQQKTGLPPSPYFSGFKLKWLIENDATVRKALQNGTALVGTMDTWLLWKLTGKHLTSVCNASRTYLIDIKTRKWSKGLCDRFGIPLTALPTIVSNCGDFGTIIADCAAKHTPITGLIGDQQGACVGQLCFEPGAVKNTYGTGCFLLMNTGTKPQYSKHGLLTTVCYQLGEKAEPAYALEGSVVQAGMLITWLKDNLKLVKTPQEVAEFAALTPDSGGIAIVPAFAGLFAPHWRPDARGVICGLTMFTKKEHICRAALTSIAMQCVDVIGAMEKDSGIRIKSLKADGGMTENAVLMQMQADLAKIDVVVPDDKETTALGSAICAAIGSGALKGIEEVKKVCIFVRQ